MAQHGPNVVCTHCGKWIWADVKRVRTANGTFHVRCELLYRRQREAERGAAIRATLPKGPGWD